MIDLNFYTTWIQIHKLPVGYRMKSMIKNLIEKKVGKVVEVQTDVQGAGNFVRARVRLDVRVPLGRFVSLSRGGQREIFAIKYEKMPRFCSACGLVGHSHLECGAGEYEEANLKWGEFLKADWETWVCNGAVGTRGGGRSGRGGREQRGGFAREGGRGNNPPLRGGMTSWRHNAIGSTELANGRERELDDTAASPVKNQDEVMDEKDDRTSSDSGTKRLLQFHAKGTILNDDVTKDLMVTDGGALPESDETDSLSDNNKRLRKDGAVSPSNRSAGSFEEPVREQ
jgi:hypothetical protein